MKKPVRKTWFLIADGGKAVLFESMDPRDGWTQLEKWTNDKAGLADHELGDAAEGHGRKTVSGSGFVMKERSPHDRHEEAFIKKRADFLNSKAHKNAFDQVVLALPPRALSDMRNYLSHEVISRTISLIDKDLLHMPETEMYTYFRDHVENW